MNRTWHSLAMWSCGASLAAFVWSISPDAVLLSSTQLQAASGGADCQMIEDGTLTCEDCELLLGGLLSRQCIEDDQTEKFCSDDPVNQYGYECQEIDHDCTGTRLTYQGPNCLGNVQGMGDCQYIIRDHELSDVEPELCD